MLLSGISFAQCDTELRVGCESIGAQPYHWPAFHQRNAPTVSEGRMEQAVRPKCRIQCAGSLACLPRLSAGNIVTKPSPVKQKSWWGEWRRAPADGFVAKDRKLQLEVGI